jgi:outer membrane protein assembly factor BamD (BamD/ComL family)
MTSCLSHSFFLGRFTLFLFCLMWCTASLAQTTNAPPKEFSEAERLLSAKRPAEAIRLLEWLQAQHKEGDIAAKILVNLHAAYVQAGRPKEAEKTAQTIVARFPGHPVSEPFLWSAIEKTTDLNQRAELSADYLKYFPNGPHAAQVKKLGGEAKVQTALRKPPAELRQAAEELYNARQFAEAMQVYEQMQKNPADKELAQFRIAFCQWWLHNYKEAVQGWLQLADKSPQSKYAPEALQMAGRTYTGPLHDGDKALALFQRIIKEYPQSSEAEPATYSIAILNYWMKRNQAAKKAFEDFIKTYPNSVYVPAAQKILSEL